MAIKSRNREGGLLADVLLSAIVILAVLFCIFPFFLIFSSSLSSETSIRIYGYSLIPREFTLDAYKIVLNAQNSLIAGGYKTTVIVTVTGTVLSSLITILAAYPLSRKKYKFRSGLNFFVFFTMLFNGGLVPWYMATTQWYGLHNNYAALIVPYLASAWNVFLLRNFMSAIPDEMEESAKIDGAGNFRILFAIFVPMCTPGIATVTLFNVITYWNDWWLGLMLLDGNKIVPLQLFLLRIMESIDFLAQSAKAAAFAGRRSIPTETVRMAICMLTIGPIIFVYPFFQKHIVKGMLVGSVKG